jgi:hypothetical protein
MDSTNGRPVNALPLRVAALALLALIFAGCPKNNPPDAPLQPAGDTVVYVDSARQYAASAVDPDGDSVALRFDWDYGDTSEWSALVGPGETAVVPHAWTSSGFVHVRAQARDKAGLVSGWSDSLPVSVLSPGDEPPLTPDAPLGPDSSRVRIDCTFRVSTTDVDNDPLEYRFDWGAGDTSAWLGPLPAGDTLSTTHAWTALGAYDVRAQARDADGFGSLSGWSPPHNVIIR